MLRFERGARGAWRDQIHQNYPQRLLGFLRRELPEHDDELLSGKSDRAIWRAGGWGLSDEQSVTTYAVLAVSHGENFAEEAWARSILMDERLPPPRRIELVYEAAVRRATVAGTPMAEEGRRHDP